MDLDLWGPPHQAIPQETYNSLLPGPCHFQDDGCGVDWFQLDAQNEAACKQVLRILIQKADVETDELQKELGSLTNKLAWVENEEWLNICCNALKQKIHCLSLSLRSLRSKGEGRSSECFKMLEPAETISELLEGLLRKYHGMSLQQGKFWIKMKSNVITDYVVVIPLPDIAGQNGHPLDICMKEASLYVPVQLTGLVSSDNEMTSVPHTASTDNDDQMISCMSKECESGSLFLEFQEEKSVNSEKIEHYRQAATEGPLKLMECDSDGRSESCAKSASCSEKTPIKLKLEWTKEAENVPLASTLELQDYASKSAFRSPKIEEGDTAETTGVGESESNLSSVAQQQQRRKKKPVSGTSKIQSVVSKAKESKNKARKVVSGRKKRRKEFDDSAYSVEMRMRDASSSPNEEITECSSLTEVTIKDEFVTSSAGELNLARLLLPELRVIAKQLNLKSVSKVKKPELVQKIAKAMGIPKLSLG